MYATRATSFMQASPDLKKRLSPDPDPFEAPGELGARALRGWGGAPPGRGLARRWRRGRAERLGRCADGSTARAPRGRPQVAVTAARGETDASGVLCVCVGRAAARRGNR